MTRPRLTLSEVHQKLQAQKDGAKQRTFFEDLEDKLEAEHRKLLEKDRKEKLEKLEKKAKKKSKKRKRSHDSSSDDSASKKQKKDKKKKKKKDKEEKRKDKEDKKKKRKSKDKSGPVKLSEFFQSSDDSSEEESSIDSIKETERNKKFGEIVTDSKSPEKREEKPKPKEKPIEKQAVKETQEKPQNESLPPDLKVSEIATTTERQFVPVEFPNPDKSDDNRSDLDMMYLEDAPQRDSDRSRGHRTQYTESYRSRRPPAHPYHRQGDYPSSKYDKRDYSRQDQPSHRRDHPRNATNDRRGARGRHEPDWEKPQ